mmetsp:Transcript_135904/g.434802  ORF Transcript_135904/g.434802 Transcript_135904/m.434802 type:complete len:286 (-) Transcript_135904:452-1309(-)
MLDRTAHCTQFSQTHSEPLRGPSAKSATTFTDLRSTSASSSFQRLRIRTVLLQDLPVHVLLLVSGLRGLRVHGRGVETNLRPRSVQDSQSHDLQDRDMDVRSFVAIAATFQAARSASWSLQDIADDLALHLHVDVRAIAAAGWRPGASLSPPPCGTTASDPRCDAPAPSSLTARRLRVVPHVHSDCASHRACYTSHPRRWCSCRSHPRAAHLALKSFNAHHPPPAQHLLDVAVAVSHAAHKMHANSLPHSVSRAQLHDSTARPSRRSGRTRGSRRAHTRTSPPAR